MPVYEYYCSANGKSVETLHSMKESISTWGELCDKAKIEIGDTPPDAKVERLVFPTGISTPAGDSHLKEMGFTKLVKRDKGVYENVTATDDEKRYMKAGDPSSLPHFSKKIED
ncbi:MAG: hypothetical protein PHX74_02825 [Candidatus Sumerlaeales bacterium]|nr:hypothetical protein [Candidatus Sumerlaeales bacterium]